LPSLVRIHKPSCLACDVTISLATVVPDPKASLTLAFLRLEAITLASHRTSHSCVNLPVHICNVADGARELISYNSRGVSWVAGMTRAYSASQSVCIMAAGGGTGACCARQVHAVGSCARGCRDLTAGHSAWHAADALAPARSQAVNKTTQ